MKVCTNCKRKRQLSSFYFRQDTQKHRNECIECVKKRVVIFYKTHPKLYDGRSIRWRKTAYGNWSTYKSNAKRKNLTFELSINYFKELSKQQCSYCGDRLDKLENKAGVDRIDNTKGYILKNCVPCCWFCNKTKLDRNRNIFINHCKKIVDFQIKKGVL